MHVTIQIFVIVLVVVVVVTGFSQPTIYKSVSVLFLFTCIALILIVARGFPAHAYT